MNHPFSRTELLLGKDAMERLYAARVAVFGIGAAMGGLLMLFKNQLFHIDTDDAAVMAAATMRTSISVRLRNQACGNEKSICAGEPKRRGFATL